MTARPTMTELIAELRTMCEAGTADYSVGTVTYWSDDQLQAILDRLFHFHNFEGLIPVPQYGIGTTYYYDFYANGEWWEGSATIRGYTSGTSGAMGTINPANYSFDNVNGIVSFTNPQGTLGFTITGNTFDMNKAAAEVWRKKAGHYAAAYDFSTDNHSLKRSQLMAQAQEMARFYGGQGGQGFVTLERGDC
jgi:hypothetical protein